MYNYLSLLEQVKENGYDADEARDNMPTTKMLPSRQMTFNFSNGFPIITGKKMPFYSILGELVGFMKGITDVREYSKLGCNVWWHNAYKWNISEVLRDLISIESYRKLSCQNRDAFRYDLGRIYAAQWRERQGINENEVETKDQLVDLINSIIDTPFSRYHIMDSWDPIQMNIHNVSQPNCHVYFQATCFKKPIMFDIDEHLRSFLTDDTVDELYANGYNPTNILATHLTQRSADMFLGVPFNVTSYSLLTILLGIFTNTCPTIFDWVGVNTHLYSNHTEQANEYISRRNELYSLPKLRIKNIKTLFDIENLSSLNDLKDHFELVDYKCHNAIKAPLSVGL